jgi:hypothetical protein
MGWPSAGAGRRPQLNRTHDVARLNPYQPRGHQPTIPLGVHITIVSPLVRDVCHLAEPSARRSFQTLICRPILRLVDGRHLPPLIASAPALLM